MGTPRVAHLLCLFADDLKALVAKLETLDSAAWSACCHKIKSSSRLLGFKRLHDHGEEVRTRAKAARVTLAIDGLRAEMQRAIEFSKPFGDRDGVVAALYSSPAPARVA